MQLLLTTISTMLLIVSLIAMIRAAAAADRAEHHERSLRNALGRLAALEGSHESLMAQHRKLSGRFYALRADLTTPEDDVADEPVFTDPEPSRLAVCENYALSQTQGPQSAAARCDCPYCMAMRRARHNAKAALVPKGNAARIEAIERGLRQT